MYTTKSNLSLFIQIAAAVMLLVGCTPSKQAELNLQITTVSQAIASQCPAATRTIALVRTTQLSHSKRVAIIDQVQADLEQFCAYPPKTAEDVALGISGFIVRAYLARKA